MVWWKIWIDGNGVWQMLTEESSEEISRRNQIFELGYSTAADDESCPP